MNLSSSKLLIMDRGELSHVAEFLARYFGKTYYHCITSDPYPDSPIAHIGEGLPDVEWTDRPWKLILKDKIDLVFFPDVYDSDQALIIQKLGIPVSGCLNSSIMELDKYHFKTVCHNAGLPVTPTHRCEGLDDLWEYVKDKEGPLFLKSLEPYRGDWETYKHRNKYATELHINQKRDKLGLSRSKAIEIGVEKPAKSVGEIGVDGFRLNGNLPKQIPCGYELKDAGIIEKVFEGLPPVLQKIYDALSPEYEKLGCQGPYSSENIITDGGKLIPIDETLRCGSPTTGAIMEMYGEKYAEMIYALAHGEMIEVKDYTPYGAELMLNSEVYLEREIHVGMSKEVAPHVRLRNSHKKDGQWYCVPNGTGSTFGTLAASGKTPKEAYEKVLEMADHVEVDHLDYDDYCFEECEKAIEAGKEIGIDW